MIPVAETVSPVSKVNRDLTHPLNGKVLLLFPRLGEACSPGVDPMGIVVVHDGYHDGLLETENVWHDGYRVRL